MNEKVPEQKQENVSYPAQVTNSGARQTTRATDAKIGVKELGTMIKVVPEEKPDNVSQPPHVTSSGDIRFTGKTEAKIGVRVLGTMNEIVPEEKSENVSEPLPRLAYTMEETAKILGVSYITVHRLLKRGLLRSSSALRHKVIPITEIHRFLKSTLR